MFWSEENVMRGGSTDKNPGKRLVSCAGCSPSGPGRVAESVPAARLQIRPGETRVVSVLV